jgi:hypothetical protein
MTLLLAAAAAGAEARPRSPAGEYRLVGEQDVASGLRLGADGRFQYFLVAGALDEQAEGRWTLAAGDRIALVTEPKPVPPVFREETAGRTDSASLTVRVASPDGSGIAGVDLRLGFDSGEPLLAYTQEDGWSLPADERRAPRWIQLAVPMHGLVSPRFPIEAARGNVLHFTLVPNNLGILDFEGIGVRIDRKALVVERDGAELRYERVGRAR